MKWLGLWMFVVVVAGASGCADDPVASGPVTITALPLLPFSEAPSYANACSTTENAEVTATGFYATADVFYARKPPADTTTVVFSFSRCPQGLAIGDTSAGAAFLVVVTTDFEANTSRIVSFVDNNSDDLPDAETEQTIKLHTSSHLFGAAYDISSGTMYVVDGLNDRVLRYEDSTGDGIIDGGTETVFLDGAGTLVESINALSLRAPKENSVEIVQRRMIGPLRARDGYIKATDANQDGVADQVDEVSSGLPVRVEFHGYLRQGDTAVEISAKKDVTYEIRGTELLATFTGNGKLQEIGLSRPLGANEAVNVFEVGESDPVATTVATSATSTVISHIDHPLDERSPGDSVKFMGSGITGSETVVARVRGGNDDYTTCTITASTTESLTVEIPSLEFTGVAVFSFKVAPVTGPARIFGVVVREN